MNALRKNIAEMAGYVPGFQPEDAASYIKLNTNENPYPPSPQVLAAILEEAGEGLRVEMPWHEHGVAGLGLTETVLVTRAGARVLNRSARGLVVLD